MSISAFLQSMSAVMGGISAEAASSLLNRYSITRPFGRGSDRSWKNSRRASSQANRSSRRKAARKHR